MFSTLRVVMMKKNLSRFSLLTGFLGLLIAFSSAIGYAQNLATSLEDRNIDRYQQQKARMEQGDVDLLWVGDSITHFWENAGKEVWDQYYANRKAMNFAISGDAVVMELSPNFSQAASISSPILLNSSRDCAAAP